MADSIADLTARLRELLARATPGPWHTGGEDRAKAVYAGSGEDDYLMLLGIGREGFYDDVVLTVEAVNALPALLDALDRRRDEALEEAAQALEGYPFEPGTAKAIRALKGSR